MQYLISVSYFTLEYTDLLMDKKDRRMKLKTKFLPVHALKAYGGVNT